MFQDMMVLHALPHYRVYDVWRRRFCFDVLRRGILAQICFGAKTVWSGRFGEDILALRCFDAKTNRRQEVLTLGCFDGNASFIFILDYWEYIYIYIYIYIFVYIYIYLCTYMFIYLSINASLVEREMRSNTCDLEEHTITVLICSPIQD